MKLKTLGEPVREIRRRMQKKVGLFQTLKNLVHGRSLSLRTGTEYLHDPDEIFSRLTRRGSPNEYRCLAIEHKSSTEPQCSTNRHMGKPLTIKKAQWKGELRSFFVSRSRTEDRRMWSF